MKRISTIIAISALTTSCSTIKPHQAEISSTGSQTGLLSYEDLTSGEITCTSTITRRALEEISNSDRSSYDIMVPKHYTITIEFEPQGSTGQIELHPTLATKKATIGEHLEAMEIDDPWADLFNANSLEITENPDQFLISYAIPEIGRSYEMKIDRASNSRGEYMTPFYTATLNGESWVCGEDD